METTCTYERNNPFLSLDRPLQSVPGLVADRNWEELRVFLSTKIQDAANYVASLDDGGESILHITCQQRPPVDIIEKIIAICPLSITSMNERGQTPLHICCLRGASPQVIKLLVEKFSPAASIQDVDGKTPLHLSCENCSIYRTNCENEEMNAKFVQRSFMSVIKVLWRTAPKTVNTEDKDGITPLEYAIYNDANFNTIRALQRASERTWTSKGATVAAASERDSMLSSRQTMPEVSTNSNLTERYGTKNLLNGDVPPLA